MKTLIASLAIAASALVATAPASAQWNNGPRWQQDQRFGRGGGDIHRQLDRIAVRIDRNFQRGTLTRGEAQRLRNQLDNIARLDQRYARNGYSRSEWQDLNRRVAVLNQRLQNQRFDNDVRRW
jgi:hypothetical protein